MRAAASDLISKKTRREFREHLVAWGTLRTIAEVFDDAGVGLDEDYVPNVSGQRRTLIEQYYHAVDFTQWADVRPLLDAFAAILMDLEIAAGGSAPFTGPNEHAVTKLATLRRFLKRDGFEYVEERVVPVGSLLDVSGVANATRFDLPELDRQLRRLGESVEADPALALGTSKELVETTCKTILEERNRQFSEDWDLTRLVKETRDALDLLPDDVPRASKGVESIRKVLGNLGSIAQGLAEIRNLYGTGHGRHGSSRGVQARHARLAAGCAATLCTFLFETHHKRDGE